ncbi:hypothetical protein BGX27_009507 [Mortierella sp. AM989]|nr:hypothetical protein BGX27_009507 [Mortierella sp. AM989]
MSSTYLEMSHPRSMPPECLERIIYHASQDHRVLSVLMQVNSTLFRMATPYLYREPFKFLLGDEFLLDWDTTTWTRHLREIRHAKLLLLYLSCSDTLQSLLGAGKAHGKRNSEFLSSSIYWDNRDLINKTSSSHCRMGQASIHPGLLEPDTDFRSTPSCTSSIGRIPVLLEKLLRSHHLGEGPVATNSLLRSYSLKQKSIASSSYTVGKKLGSAFSYCSSSSRLSVNYLDYVEHLDLDTFLSTSIQVLFSPSSSIGNENGALRTTPSQQYQSSVKGNQYSVEKAFVERILLRSTAQHITTLSISIGTFVRLQRDLMEHVMEPLSSATAAASSSSSSSATAAASSSSPQPATKNSAGLGTGMPLSQLSRLNISGLHAELKPKVLRAIRWFLRRHVAVYPGMLKAIAFEGPGDTIVNRRRQRNRNVVAVEPVQPGVVHFNNQHADDDTTDEIEEEHEHHTINQLQQQHQHQNYHQHQHQNHHNQNQPGNIFNNVLFADGAGHVNNIPPNANVAAPPEVFPAVFHSQYYLLSRNPDESCEIDFMSIIQELRGQLEIVDLSQWSWSVITQQALDMIPVSQLSTLRFHPRTRIQWRHGPSFLRNCPVLKVLQIHAFDPEMLDLDSSALVQGSTISGLDSSSLSYPSSLNTLSLTGSVPNVLPAVRDAIRIMGKSLDTINLAAHLDGFLSDQQTHQLMDWSTSLSTLTIPQLTTLQLHGHLALSFDAPMLLELCPTLRHFGLTIKSYTSSSFVNSELARVLPRFMTPLEEKGLNAGVQKTDLPAQMFQLRVLELQGPWILTEKDMDQIGDQIHGLVTLNLVGCRFYPTKRRVENVPGSGDEEDEEDEEEVEKNSPVPRLVEKFQTTLRTLHIHRRGLEGKPRRDSSDYSYYSSARCNATSPNLHRLANASPSSSESLTLAERHAEPVLAFKKRFPNVNLQIQEKQHEHSFVIAPSAEILRRIHHPQSQVRRNSLSLADIWDNHATMSAQHDYHTNDSVWRRARDAMPFLKSFGRKKSYRSRTLNSHENQSIPSWNRRRFEWSRGRPSII